MDELAAKLNANNNGAIYSVNGNTITGAWNKSAVAQGALGSDQMHLDYSITVTLNADKTFNYHENMGAGQRDVGPGANAGGPNGDPFADLSASSANNDGGINVFSASSGSFQGKTWGNKQKGFSLQFGGQKGSNSYSYNFDADKIKQPLLQTLEAAGYKEQKKSFLKSLFGK